MKRLVLLLLCLSSFAGATTTVTGNIQTLGTGSVTSGAFVRFWLRGCAGNQPRVNGTSVIGPTQGGVFYVDFSVNGSGAVSGTLYSTRDSTGLLAGDIECGGSKTAVWYGMQIFVAGKGGPEVAVHAKNTATLDISNVTPITTNPVITAPTGDSTYARLDGGNQPFLGSLTPNGNGTLSLGTTGARWKMFGSSLDDSGTALISGAATLSSTLSVSGAASLLGSATVGTTLGVTGATSLLGGGTWAGTFGGNYTTSGNNTHSGTETFSSTVAATAGETTNAFAGTFTCVSINGVICADQQAGATADLKIAAAISALPAAGGIVDARGFGCTAQTIASHLDVGSATKQVTLLVDRCTPYSVTVTGGVSAITVWLGSAIRAEGTSNPLGGNGGFVLASTANVASTINFNASGAQPIAGVSGITLRGNASATVTNGLLDILNVTDTTTISDIIVWDFTNTVGINIRTSGGTALGPINFNNVVANGMGNTGARPVKITVSGAGVMGTVNFFGGSLTHPGTGGLPIVDIQGGASGLINGVNFFGTQLENTNAADIGINCVNCNSVYGSGLLFTSASGAGTSCIKISNSGGSTTAVTFDNITNFNSWTNTIQNLINSQNIADGRVAHYTYTDTTNGSTQGRSYFPNINQTSAGQFADISACSTGTKNITFPVAFRSTPAILLFDETTAGGIKLSSKANTGFTATCTGASDAFDWIAIGDPN